MKYHKIESVFKRDPETKYKTFLEGEFSKPEFGYLFDNDWIFTEKVDGTNIRIYYWPDDEDGIPKVAFQGRTDKAQIPPKLLEALHLEGDKILNSGLDKPMIFYGEGYGAGIQKGGGNYRDTPGFVLFDIMINETFVKRDIVVQIAKHVGLDVVPVIGHFSLRDAIRYCRKGFDSNWGSFRAEGFIGVPLIPLVTNRGERIITKVKCKDFDHNASKESGCENN